MFKKSPTCQSYTVIYGIKYILDYVKKSSISNETLELALKILETMMCHLSGQRPQTLASLSTGCVYLNNSGCVFHISKLLKTSCPNSHQQPVEFNAYSYDFSLCVAALIKSHLDKTAASRHDMNSMLLLAMLSHKKNIIIKNICKVGIRCFTLGRCSNQTIQHSALISNAFSRGLPLTEIEKVAE